MIAAAWCAPLILILPHLRLPLLGLAIIGALFFLLLRRADERYVAPAS